VTGATIDHMISLTILIAALLVAMMTYNGLFASAVDYDRNRQVANKAIDITNTICLSPGSPIDWGQTNDTLLGFGLQDPQVGGYALSPYSIMRLKTVSNDSQLVYYPHTGLYYNNISANYGSGIFTPIDDCLNYSTATELLGINRTYGFAVDIAPTLNVIISEISTNPLKLNVEVLGQGLPISDATLNYYLFQTENGSPNPLITPYFGVDQTGPSGSVELIFSGITAIDPAYSLTVYVSIGGVNGVGYYTQNTVTDDQFIVPLIEDFDQGNIILAHSWDLIHPGQSAEVKYSAMFYILTSDFHLQQVEVDPSEGHVNSGSSIPLVRMQIPASEVGLLIVSYQKSATEVGSIILPWGIGTLGVSASFGGDQTGYDFVATELRQVNINNIAYQVKVSTWSLSG